MDRENVRQRVRDILAKLGKLSQSKKALIDDDDYIINAEGILRLDSLDALEIAVQIEAEFGVGFSGINTAKTALRSINILTDYILENASPETGTSNTSISSVSYAPKP